MYAMWYTYIYIVYIYIYIFFLNVFFCLSGVLSEWGFVQWGFV